jgi:hypothetical protein
VIGAADKANAFAKRPIAARSIIGSAIGVS